MSETLEAQADRKMADASWVPDVEGKGIMGGLDDLFNESPKAEPQAAVKPAKNEAQIVVEEPKKENKKSEEAKIDLEPIEEDFFKGGDEVKPDEKPANGAFDEASFDRETEEAAKSMGEKAGAKWKELRSELKAAKMVTPPETLLKELEEARTKAQEVDGLRERMKELAGKSAKLTVETSDEYVNEIKKPLAELFETLDRVATTYEIDSSILDSLVMEKDRKIQAEMIKTHVEGMDPISKSEVIESVRKYGELVKKRDGMMENAEKELSQREAKRAEESQRLIEEQRKVVQTLQKEKWSRWEKAIPGLLDENGQPTPEYLKMKSEALSLDFSQARANDMAFAALSGTLLPFAQKKIIELQRQLQEYKKKDKLAVAADPSPSSSVAQTPVQIERPKSFMEDLKSVSFV